MTAFYRRIPFAQHVQALLIARARPIRFACVGGISALIQLALLHSIAGHGWNTALAEIIALLLAAQVNFFLNTTVTWRDRHVGAARQTLRRRWFAFHGSITWTTLLNFSVFTAAHLAMPALYAAALGIIAAAAVNFVTFDRFVFRPAPVKAM